MALALSAGSSCVVDAPRRIGVGDGGFGPGAPGFPRDGSPDDTGGDGGSAGTGVRVRLVQGIANLGVLRVCYDPDFVPDDPTSRENEGALGTEPARPLSLLGLYGTATEYRSLDPLSSGALTFHGPRLDEPHMDAGVSQDGGLEWDAGSDDAAIGAAPLLPKADEPCSADTLEAFLPLPFGGEWLDSEMPPSAAELMRLSIADRLSAGSTITLLGSGVALDAAAVSRRVARVRATHLGTFPNDTAGADAAAAAERARLITQIGPRFVPALERARAPSSGVSMHLAHLIPDVKSADGRRPGAIRLCVTEGQRERLPLPSVDQPAVAFRTRSALGDDFLAGIRYTFRVFAADAFDAQGKECATTSLAASAELSIDSSTLESGHAYTLIATGAVDPLALCTPLAEDSVVRAGCAGRNTESVRARLLLVEDETR